MNAPASTDTVAPATPGIQICFLCVLIPSTQRITKGNGKTRAKGINALIADTISLISNVMVRVSNPTPDALKAKNQMRDDTINKIAVVAISLLFSIFRPQLQHLEDLLQINICLHTPIP